MKLFKVTKKMLKMHPMDLLVKLGAIDKMRKSVYPQHIYLSKEDTKELRKNLKELARKSHPGGSDRAHNYSVGVDWLNYGPNEILSEAIRPGYALIDEETIEEENGA